LFRAAQVVLPDPSVARRGTIESWPERRSGGRLPRGSEAVSRERVVAVRAGRCAEGPRQIRRRESCGPAICEGVVGGGGQTVGITLLRDTPRWQRAFFRPCSPCPSARSRAHCSRITGGLPPPSRLAHRLSSPTLAAA